MPVWVEVDCVAAIGGICFSGVHFGVRPFCLKEAATSGVYGGHRHGHPQKPRALGERAGALMPLREVRTELPRGTGAIGMDRQSLPGHYRAMLLLWMP